MNNEAARACGQSIDQKRAREISERTREYLKPGVPDQNYWRKYNDPESVLADPTVTFWLKNALAAALNRDPLDAADDARRLANILEERLNKIQNR